MRSLTLVLTALVLFVSAVGAQEKYPSRPIDFICTWDTGGGADAMARQIGSLAQPILGVALPGLVPVRQVRRHVQDDPEVASVLSWP